jgi:DNA repair exonuclease SbcCD ATPase subunit
MKNELLLTFARGIVWRTWMTSGDDLASSAVQAFIDEGMLVEPGGAAELEDRRKRLPEVLEQLRRSRQEAKGREAYGKLLKIENAGLRAENRRHITANLEAAERAQREIETLRARVAELERPAIEAQRNEIRDVLNTSRAEAEQGRDFEGAATVAQQLDAYEAKWAAEDAPPAPPRGASEIKHPAIRRTRAHFAENPLPEQRQGGAA